MKLTLKADDFKGIPPLEPGKYPFKVGKPEVVVQEGEDKFDYYKIPFVFEKTPDGISRTLTQNFSTSPKSKFFWAQLLKCLGVASGSDFEFDPMDLEGGEGVAIVGQRAGDGQYAGRIFNDIKTFLEAKKA